MFLAAELDGRDIDMADLSRQIGMSHSYIQQYLSRGVPKALPERVRARLASALGIDDSLLGGPKLTNRTGSNVTKGSTTVQVGVYNALASAGGGITLSDEDKMGSWPLPRSYLDEMNLTGSGLAVIPVKGDSMEPTLRSGDRVLIDMGDRNVSQGGLFVLWDGDGRVVKRVERILGKRPTLLVLISDNPLHSKYEVAANDMEIIGRVVWAARRL